ncbi:ester cyclase [Paraflavitalea sp. CAU 1676]|uniref:ester cyclase n=1 Tax=Paraflavitalea sp. CAU 1676 TaxID=3032598 RepID=UPI0023DB0560|nr:ester cyclase [Paraflavitalea sp. CAU 1676]MDF2191566.1 ester cyclase [Paraflavitalea sp. CAU 1676]
MIVIHQDNKEIVKHLYADVLNKHDFARLKEFVSDDYVGALGTKGPAGFGEPLQLLVRAFPDLQWQVQELVAEGSKVVVRWKLSGTHTGTPFNQIAAAGRPVSGNGAIFFELKEGKVVSAMVFNDRLGFLQDLGALPKDQQSLNALMAERANVNSGKAPSASEGAGKGGKQ